MSFTDQKPRIAAEEDTKAQWSGGKQGEYFRCKLCGHRFQVGDYWRWVFVKGYVNLIVCQKCDTPDATEHWIQACRDWKLMKEHSPFWWFIAQLEEAVDQMGHPTEEKLRRQHD